MPPTSETRIATLSFLLLVAMATCLEAKTLKQSDIVFYTHDNEFGPNATRHPVSGIPKQNWGIIEFGTIYVISSKLTEGYDINSPKVGETRGMYANSALDGSDLHYAVSIVFTNEKYNGSTLEVHGSNRYFNKYREMPIISGTGKFRFARGYVILETVFLDLRGEIANAIIRWNLTVLHY